MTVELRPAPGFSVTFGPVTFHCHRASTVAVATIRHRAEMLAQARQSQAKRVVEDHTARGDGSVPGMDTLSAIGALSGMAEAITAEAMFDAGLITGWDGFTDHGEPVPLTRETWSAFLENWGADALAVCHAIMDRMRLRAAEGNG